LPETSPTHHSTALDPTQTTGVTHGRTNKPFTVQLHSGWCYTKIRGNGFRLLNQTKDIPRIIGGNREPRRDTTDVHSLPILLFCFSSISRAREEHVLSLFSFSFFVTELYGVYISLYMHFGVKDRRELLLEGKLDLRLRAFASCCTTIFGVLLGRRLSLDACRVWVDYTRRL
jgi:hypothetical protein